jgi:NAD(P)-dependent dehydrogenase (short-subunit alcohol dehydrogenase family)
MQTIVITGASGGIGIELVNCFLFSGWRVIAISRNIDELEKIKNDNLILLKANINEAKEIERIEKICSTFSDIQIVINNAGTLINKPFLNITEGELISTYQTNVFAPFLLLQKLIPILNKTERAHVVNIGSMGGFQGSAKFAGLTAYSSSKFALAGLTELLAEEFKSENISFNCLAIGAAQTKMLEKAFPGYQAPVSAREMAEFIFNFASKQAKFINGKIIPVSVSTP